MQDGQGCKHLSSLAGKGRLLFSGADLQLRHILRQCCLGRLQQVLDLQVRGELSKPLCKDESLCTLLHRARKPLCRSEPARMSCHTKLPAGLPMSLANRGEKHAAQRQPHLRGEQGELVHGGLQLEGASIAAQEGQDALLQVRQPAVGQHVPGCRVYLCLRVLLLQASMFSSALEPMSMVVHLRSKLGGTNLSMQSAS